MKKVILFAVLVFALTLVGCNNGAGKEVPKGQLKPARRNPVIVIVDMQKVTMESDAGKARFEEIQKWAEARQEMIRTKVAQYNAADAMGKTSRRQLQGMKAELNMLQQQSQEEFNKRRLRAGDEMSKLFDPLLDKLAKQNKWDIVLNKVDQVALWTNDAMDETDYVIAELNKSTANPANPEKTEKETKKEDKVEKTSEKAK